MFIRQCPVCNRDIHHKDEKNLKRALKTNNVCRSCIASRPENIEARAKGVAAGDRRRGGRPWLRGVKQSPETIRKRLESRGMNYNEGPVWTMGKRAVYYAWSKKV